MDIMEEFKFRYFDKDLKRMVYSDEFKKYQGLSEFFSNIKDENVDQWTGIKDKNNREIYYNDIVYLKFKEKPENGRMKGTAIITRSITMGAGILYNYDSDFPEKIWAGKFNSEIEEIWEDDFLWDIKVIGNIHKNKNLLK